MPSLLGYRPVNAVHRLAPRSEACPLSSRHLLAAARAAPLPLVVAPTVLAVRAALRAGHEARAAIGLALPPGPDPRRWIDLVLREADALAPELPIALAVELAVAPGEGRRALREAEELVDAGATHLAVSAPPAERDAVAAIARLLDERELGLELVVGADDEAGFAAELRDGARLTVVGLRCAAPRDARAHARALDRFGETCGAPVLRRGPGSPELHRLLAATRVRACDDGGATLAAALRSLAPEERQALEAGDPRTVDRASLERAEALAWSEATGFVTALGAAGSASGLAARLAELLE
jgi:hypothetical protein